ncbi:MAG TPA: hypothetical protein VGU44_06060 [Gammaproteobacteria bacterium]|nr:hypothetical protein [Gammaproteobacteria bacterium]
MLETYTTLVKNKIAAELVNTNFDPDSRNADQFLFSNKQVMFEQYKMLVDSAHKAEERRGVSNNIFLGINGLLASFFVFPEKIIHIQIMESHDVTPYQ